MFTYQHYIGQTSALAKNNTGLTTSLVRQKTTQSNGNAHFMIPSQSQWI